MSRLLDAMKARIAEIVKTEGRPFSLLDFREFESGGQKYQMKSGTFINNILSLRRGGYVELAYKSGIAFYTIPGKTFTKTMTQNRMGLPTDVFPEVKETPIYKWVKNRPFKQQSLHNIRLTFEANGIWNVCSNIYPDKIDPNNKDIKLPSMLFFNYINVNITIHHTDIVSVAVACSSRPIVVDLHDMPQLFEVLIRAEIQVYNIIDDYCRNNGSPSTIAIPSFRKWIVKLWHFGSDSLDEYNGKEFHVTFQKGISELFRIYTKRIEGNKNKIRIERQQYPNQEAADAFVKKLFPNGHLIDVMNPKIRDSEKD